MTIEYITQQIKNLGHHIFRHIIAGTNHMAHSVAGYKMIKKNQQCVLTSANETVKTKHAKTQILTSL